MFTNRNHVFCFVIIIISGNWELFYHHRNSLLQPGNPSLSDKTQRRAANCVYDCRANDMAEVN